MDMILPDQKDIQDDVEIKNEDIVAPVLQHLDEKNSNDEETKDNLNNSSCDKSFDDPIKLNDHDRSQTSEREFECDSCDKTFTSNANLTIHLRTHTDERPFECDLCDEAFKQNSHLVRHRRIHTGEKPFSCDICHKAFAGHGGLWKHKKSVHTEMYDISGNVIPGISTPPDTDDIKSERPLDYEDTVTVPMPVTFVEPKVENEGVAADDVDIKLEPGSSR